MATRPRPLRRRAMPLTAPLITGNLLLLVGCSLRRAVGGRGVCWLTARFDWSLDDPEIVSDMLFALANVWSIARTTYLMPAFEVLGPLQISLGRMLGDITRFLVLFTLVRLTLTLAITVLTPTPSHSIVVSFIQPTNLSPDPVPHCPIPILSPTQAFKHVCNRLHKPMNWLNFECSSDSDKLSYSKFKLNRQQHNTQCYVNIQQT